MLSIKYNLIGDVNNMNKHHPKLRSFYSIRKSNSRRCIGHCQYTILITSQHQAQAAENTNTL